MAERVERIIWGVDVSRDELAIAGPGDEQQSVANERLAIVSWLEQLPPMSRLGIESTGCYHEALVEAALAQGMEVYLISGKQLHHYREAVGPRAKNDSCDAGLLRRYLRREQEQLRPVQAITAQEKQLWRLLKRRATLVKVMTQLKQSMAEVAELDPELVPVKQAISRLLRRIDRTMATLARSLGWQQEMARCRSIPGIGPLNALALVAAYHRGTFTRADQFVAYLGLDVCVRDSGRQRGKRKLTKRGEPELRRLLYNAAMSFARNPLYRDSYEQLVQRGLSGTAALVALSRKLVRTAFALLNQDRFFDPDRFRRTCAAT